MSWIDLPRNADDTFLAIVVDLDLFVVSPGGAKTYGNRRANQDTDGHSTTEKIIMANADPGTYEIHVVANPSAGVSSPVWCSLVVNGPFVHTDFAANPAELGSNIATWATPSCSQLMTGIHCQVLVADLASGATVTATIRPSETLYYHITPPSGSQPIDIHCQVTTPSFVLLRIYLVTNNNYKLQLARDTGAVQTTAADTLRVPLTGNPGHLYFAFYSDMYANAQISLSWSAVQAGGSSGMVWWAHIGAGILIFVTIVAVVICACGMRGSAKKRVENEPPSARSEARECSAPPDQYQLASGLFTPVRPGLNASPYVYDMTDPLSAATTELYEVEPGKERSQRSLNPQDHGEYPAYPQMPL
jgi:hypothetical protein